jgi:hypothetical protein
MITTCQTNFSAMNMKSTSFYPDKMAYSLPHGLLPKQKPKEVALEAKKYHG